MVKITLAGKLAIVLAFACIFYLLFFVIPSALMQGTNEEVSGKKTVKIFAFVKTMDESSVELSRTLEVLKKDPEISDIFSYELIVVDVEKEKAKRFAVSEEEVPCFIIGTEKVIGTRNEEWFKKKIIEVAKESGIIQ